MLPLLLKWRSPSPTVLNIVEPVSMPGWILTPLLPVSLSSGGSG